MFADLKPLHVDFVECSARGKDENSDADLQDVLDWMARVAQLGLRWRERERWMGYNPERGYMGLSSMDWVFCLSACENLLESERVQYVEVCLATIHS